LDDINKRRVMDQRKWMTVVKTHINNKKKGEEDMMWERKIIAAICSCWNYLFSNKGLREEKPMAIN
jgi:hypothetical protein